MLLWITHELFELNPHKVQLHQGWQYVASGFQKL